MTSRLYVRPRAFSATEGGPDYHLVTDSGKLIHAKNLDIYQSLTRCNSESDLPRSALEFFKKGDDSFFDKEDMMMIAELDEKGLMRSERSGLQKMWRLMRRPRTMPVGGGLPGTHEPRPRIQQEMKDYWGSHPTLSTVWSDLRIVVGDCTERGCACLRSARYEPLQEPSYQQLQNTEEELNLAEKVDREKTDDDSASLREYSAVSHLAMLPPPGTIDYSKPGPSSDPQADPEDPEANKPRILQMSIEEAIKLVGVTKPITPPLVFYNNDKSYQKVVVDGPLRAQDLCTMLAHKNNVADDRHWAIIEFWPELGLERMLEDHEDILAVHRSMKAFGRSCKHEFYFRKEFEKYEYFQDPDHPVCNKLIDMDDNRQQYPQIIYPRVSYSIYDPHCPKLFTTAWVRDSNSQKWDKTYIVLYNYKIYRSDKFDTVRAVMNEAPIRPGKNVEYEDLHELAALADVHLFKTLNAKNQFRAPSGFGIALRPRDASNAETNERALAEFKCICFESERSRLNWLSAMRLGKYGKRLQENFHLFRNRKLEFTKREKDKDKDRPRSVEETPFAPMDFKSKKGKLVTDPQQIADIQASSRRRNPPPVLMGRLNSSNPAVVSPIFAHGPHLQMPWYHKGMKRELANALLRKTSVGNGVFLVRDSHTNPGQYVVTVFNNNTPRHKELYVVEAKDLGVLCCTIDHLTYHWDILSLIEHHQLNIGCMPCLLTHFISFNAETQTYHCNSLEKLYY